MKTRILTLVEIKRWLPGTGPTRPSRRLAACIVLLVVSSGIVASPASAATLNEQRTALRQASYAAAADYVAARTVVPVLARANALAVKAAIDSGMKSLKTVGDALTVATTQPAVSAVAVRMNTEVMRAATVKQSGQQMVVLKDLRSRQQNVTTTALADALAGRIDAASYQAAKNRTSSFSTLLAADSVRQLGLLGQAVPAEGLQSTAYESALVSGSAVIPTAPGWVGFPGGCALPTASSTFQPVLPAAGPGVATNQKMVADAKAQALADPELAAVHAQLLRSAVTESGLVLSLSQLQDTYTARVARLGYGWLSGTDSKARAILSADAKKILVAGPESMDTLASSHLLLAAASASDWVKLTGLDETVLVRWIGPQTCLYEDRDNFVTAPMNISSIHNAASFVAGAVFLKRWPDQAAALAQASLKSIQPALQMITADGGTQEGPGYWTYQSRALAVLYATLLNAYSRPPLAMPSLEKVSGYALNSTGPDELPTPFGDAMPDELSPLMPAWDAYVRKDAGVAAWVAEKFREKPDAYLMWWRTTPGVLPAKRSAVYPQTGFAALQLPGSTATLKGGSNVLTHSHLDLGTVSFFRRGIQWAVDPGTMPNTTPGYYSENQRYTYWKPGTSAHSTIAFTGENQPTTATSQITALSSSSASVDLRKALPGTSEATRTLTHSTTSLVIKDVIRSPAAVNLTWQWVTDAAVSVGSNRAVLRRDGQSITIILSGVPAGSTLEAVPAPDKGPDGKALTILKLSVPRVTSLNLTTTAY